MVQKRQTITLALELRSNADRPESQNWNLPPVIGEYFCTAKNNLPYNGIAELHHEVQLRNEIRMTPEVMKDIVFRAPRPIHIPKRLPAKIFNCSVIAFRLMTDNVILIHCFFDF